MPTQEIPLTRDQQPTTQRSPSRPLPRGISDLDGELSSDDDSYSRKSRSSVSGTFYDDDFESDLYSTPVSKKSYQKPRHSASTKTVSRKSSPGRSKFGRYRARRKLALSKKKSYLGRHPIFTWLLAIILLMTPIWWSLGNALTDPTLGTSIPGRFAEWVRDHGGKSIVVWAENEWYLHNPPPVGGKPPNGAIPPPSKTSTTISANQASKVLPTPNAIVPFSQNPVPGEGQWHPVGRYVNGVPAIYEAFLSPD
ncbi:MAG: hypothetical protein HKL80_08825, partial [Acidimicrobiales bacterium]|nr:hypothetical protein [Acidimicrobiales bacterium]